MIGSPPVVIEVAPVAQGWAVRASSLPNEMMFAGGGAAEAAARSLAERLSEAGQPVRLVVRLRNGAIAGRFIYAPSLAAADPASPGEVEAA
jgi:hypothetical protein